MPTPSWAPTPTKSRRPKYSRPTPLEFRKEREEADTLPATVYSPEFDEIEEPEQRPATPTDISGLFDNSDTSDTSSAASSRAESPIDRDRVVFARGHKRRDECVDRRMSVRSVRSVRSARRGSGGERRERREERDSRDGAKTPSTPVTPMSPFAPSTNFKPPSSKRGSSSSGDSPTWVPVNPSYPVRPSPSSSSSSGKANAILGIGIGHPPLTSSRISTPGAASPTTTKFKDPVLDNWDVSDSDSNKTPMKPLPLKPWGPLAVGAKKTPTPSITSIRSVDRSRLGRSNSSASGRFVRPKIENPQPKHAVRARFSEMRGYEDDRMSLKGGKGGPLDSGVAFKLVRHPTHSQSSADIRTPDRAPSTKKPPSSSSSYSSTSSSSSIHLPKRSPSAPIVASVSTVSFELTEYPVMFSALPVEETEIFNIIPTDFIMSDERSPSPPPQTLHPSWNKFDENVYASSDIARKAELNALAAMMDPASPQAVSYRARYNQIDSVGPGGLEVPSPSPASVRPNSRWSDYSEADSVKESWRSSVLNHFHLPSVTTVRRKLDLRAPVAAAKEGIRKMGVKEVTEIKEVKEGEEIVGTGRKSGEGTTSAGAFNPTLASVAAAGHRGSMSSGSGLFRTGSRIGVGRSDSIVTLSKNILRPDSRAEKGPITGPSPLQNTPKPIIARPVSTPKNSSRPNSGRQDPSPLTATTTLVISPVGSPSSDGEERVASPGSRGFKGVFEKYMAKDPRKKEERRRLELKKKITVIGAGQSAIASSGGYI